MTQYKVVLRYPDGTEEEDDYIFDTEKEAEEYGLECVSCSRVGAETLNLSNPGDYPLDDYEDPDFEIIEIEA